MAGTAKAACVGDFRDCPAVFRQENLGPFQPDAQDLVVDGRAGRVLELGFKITPRDVQGFGERGDGQAGKRILLQFFHDAEGDVPGCAAPCRVSFEDHSCAH